MSNRPERKQREIIKEQEDKGVKEQISNLQSRPPSKIDQPIKFSDALKSDLSTQSTSTDSSSNLNLNLGQQQQLGSQNIQSSLPKKEFGGGFHKQYNVPYTETSKATERNIVYVPKTRSTELGSSKEATQSLGSQRQEPIVPKVSLGTSNLVSRPIEESLKAEPSKKESSNLPLKQEKLNLEKDVNKEGDLNAPKREELSTQNKEANLVPPQTSLREGEALSSTFTQVPSFDINEEKIKEYLMSALGYLKEAEEKMVEKFAEARAKIMEMHPQEKLSHAVDVTKDKALYALGYAIDEGSTAKEGIVHTYDRVKDSVVHIAEKVSESAKTNYDILKVKLQELSHKTVEEYDIAKEKIGEYSHRAQEFYETTKHKVQDSEITHKAQEMYESTKHIVQESEIAHKAQDIYESTKHKIEDISEEVVEKAKEFLTVPTGDLHEAAERVRENVEGDREAELKREREEREKRESLEEERERVRLLKEEDENTRIRLMSEEAPQSLPK